MKIYSWRSYTFFIVSILVALSMILLDPIAVFLGGEWATPFLLIIIGLGAFLSIILLFMTVFNKKEKKIIAIFATILTIVNLLVISFFVFFGIMLSS